MLHVFLFDPGLNRRYVGNCRIGLDLTLAAWIYIKQLNIELNKAQFWTRLFKLSKTQNCKVTYLPSTSINNDIDLFNSSTRWLFVLNYNNKELRSKSLVIASQDHI